ncbi:MAG: tRNA epoxyqueuosine(34) reductase QueG [Anaerolineales bacterium]|nr:tRNA epoxyqueuosine(34) reductase QueG [Anaerolineales bacterium]
MCLKQAIKNKSRQLGFILAGVTSCEPPLHYDVFENWLNAGQNGTMDYLADEKSRIRRAHPKLILPECESILVLGISYHPPISIQTHGQGQVAAYAWGDDYHEVLLKRLRELVAFIEEQVGHPIPNRYYTDTGPVLERDLAQRAGLGWIGKNTCLINPHHGSYFLLSEILLGVSIEPDTAFISDHCGTCTRCIKACPTHCIQPNRTLDAKRCISYLTIELKDDIPINLRPLIKDWIFGCDVCQIVCPWNRFADQDGDSAFQPHADIPLPVLTDELSLTSQAFNLKFKRSPVKRAKRRGYLRNVAVALGNTSNEDSIQALQQALEDSEPIVRKHARWAIEQIERRAIKK